jgi:AcrR family transcriptional regulator
MGSDLELRERILQHARGEFLAHGFSKVTVDEIATQLGISKKTLYALYPSKEELLRASLHAMIQSAGEELERISTSEKPFVEKVTQALIVMSGYVQKIRKESIADFQRNVPSLWREIDKFRQEHIVSKLITMIARARSENIFRPDANEQVLLQMFVSSIQGVLNPEILTRHSFSLEEGARSIFRILFEGALTDSARKEFHLLDQPTALLDNDQGTP